MIAPGPRYIAIFDAGKANAKLGIIDTATIAECAVDAISLNSHGVTAHCCKPRVTLWRSPEPP